MAAIASLGFIGLSGCGGSAKPIDVTVSASATTVDGTDSVNVTASVANDKTPGGVTWSVSGGGALTNQTSSSATYTAPAATASSQTITITATSVADTTKNGPVVITVPAAPAVTSTSASLAGMVGTAYSVTLQASGGISPYNWSLAGATTLPSCLKLSSSGVITTTSGMAPTASCAGTYSDLTFNVTDSGTQTALSATSAPLSITIAAAPLITFTGTVPATGTYSVAYTGSAAATGGAGALTYSISTGALPGDLSLNTSTGAISGNPNKAADVGTFNFTVMAADAYGDTATKSYSIVISYPALTVTAATLPTGYMGSIYTSTTLAATGGSGTGFTWAPTSALPAGLSLSAGGVITGTPTATGTTSFTVKVTDSASNTANGTFSITVDAGITITTGTTLPAGYTGSNYSQQLAATGGTGAGTYSWAVTGGSLPVGVTLSSGGLLSGHPTATGTPSFTVTVTDTAHNTANATFGVTINPGVSINSITLPAGYQGTAYAGATFTAIGGTGTGYTWSWTGNPNGLTLGASTGTIGGTTNVPGSFTLVVTATDSAGNTTTSSFPLTIEASIAITSTSPLNPGTVAMAYSAQLAATGGTGTYTWSTDGPGTTSLASVGLTLSATGLVVGASPTLGSATFTATVTDTASHTTSAVFTVSITNALAITPSSLPAAYTNTLYTQTLAGAGGSGSGYTFSVSGSSNLATFSLTLSSGGVLSGTPTTTGTATFTAKVTDSASNTAMVTYSIPVYNPLTLPTPNPATLGPATLNVLYSGTVVASGGSGSGYTWTVTGLPADGLTYSSSGGTLTISGTPTTAETVSFTASVKDSLGNTAGPIAYTIMANNALTLPAPNPGSLGSAAVSLTYNGTIVASGGSGSGYTFTVTGLPADGLSSTSSGGTLTISGTPTGAQTVTFTASVKDSLGNTAGPFTYTIVVYSAVTLPSPSSTVPGPGTTGVVYAGAISATGGTGSYTWTVTGFPSDGLSESTAGGTLSIFGTPTSATTVTFTAKVTDTTTNSVAGPYTYNIVVSNPAPLTLPGTTPSTLGSATVNQTYAGYVDATGGIGPYTWKINGAAVSGTPFTLSDGLSATTTGNATLSVSGTPTSTGSVPLTSVTVTDSEGTPVTAGPYSYSVVVNSAGAQVNGQIYLTNACNSTGNLPAMTVTVNTTPVQTTTTDSNGNYSFASVPNGTWTVTPSITGASSVFYPATQSITVSGNPVTAGIIGAALGYSVSGSVSYGGSQTGRTYVDLVNNNCGGSGGNGTSISTPGSFTINGVPPGSYTLQAWMDPSTLAEGALNTADPAGSTGVTVNSANVTGQSVTMTDPSLSVPTTSPSVQELSPIDQGVAITFSRGSVSNNNGVEEFTSYTIEWSPNSSFTGTPGSIVLKAIGSSSNVWIINSGTSGISGSFANGTAYYFRVRGSNPAGNGPWAVYGSPTAVTVGAPTTGNSVSGVIIIPSDITVKAGARLYAGLYDQSGNAAYAAVISSPTNSISGNAFTVHVPSGSNYILFGILDQNNDGLIDAGDVNNTNNNNAASIVVTGTLTGQDATLPDVDAAVQVQTYFSQDTYWNGTSSSTNTNYSLGLGLQEQNKLPVAVQLVSASNPNVLTPQDISDYCQGCGSTRFSIQPNIGTDVPAVNDSYTFHVTYSDGTTANVTGTVTAVLGTSALATSLEPEQTDSTSTTPTFTWTYPTNASSYTYSFYICCGSNGTIWQIPGNNSNLNGFPSTVTQIVWGTDPTGDGGNTPNPSSLTLGTQYQWTIQTQDSNGNSASNSVWYQP
ncbi:MAG: putative Ig domain-containing protein [Terracidiphilus sp.]